MYVQFLPVVLVLGYDYNFRLSGLERLSLCK